MYVKTSVRKTKTGEVRYLQLAHNEWDAAKGRSVPRVIYGFGREDQLDKEAVRRLVASLSRFLEPGEVPASPGEGLEFAESRPYGGAYVLDRLWQRLGIGTILTGLASSGRGRPRDAAAAERVLFGLVANRALAPSSKLAASEWMSRDVHIDGLGEVGDDACYRAMDWLHDVRGELEKQVYFQVADLLNLQVDLLFFDTTPTYFETGAADEEVPRDWRGEKTAGQDTASGGRAGAGEDDEENPAGRQAGFREYGKSKDSRDDLPQVVIGLAVTREGIPVRVWCWPGSTADSALIRQVKKDMRDWSLGRVIWVADRGFTSKENRKFLQAGGDAYIIGEKLRSGSAEAQAALSRQGRYKTVAGNLQVKEVRLPDAADRFIICFNPGQAVRDAAVRAQDDQRAGRDDRRVRRAQRHETGRAAREDLHDAGAEPVPARHPRWPAPGRQGESQGRGEPRRQVPAAQRRPGHDRRGHRRRLQAAPGSRARLARHEIRPGPAPGLPPARRAHPRPRPPVLARAPAHPRRREPGRADLARHAPRAPAHPHRHLHRVPPAPSASAPTSPRRPATCSAP